MRLLSTNIIFFKFKENFNYKFGRPQVDVCSQCEDLGNKLKSTSLNKNTERVTSAELIVNKKKAKKFDLKMKSIVEISKNRKDVAAVVFDYMQNLPLPLLPVQEMFYLRKLWHNVFCVHNIFNNKAVFYTYNEGIVRKGSR